MSKTRARLRGLLLGLALAVGAAAGVGISYLVAGPSEGLFWQLLFSIIPGLLIGVYLYLFPSTMQRADEQRERRKEDISLSLRILGVALLSAIVVGVVFLIFGSL